MRSTRLGPARTGIARRPSEIVSFLQQVRRCHVARHEVQEPSPLCCVGALEHSVAYVSPWEVPRTGGCLDASPVGSGPVGLRMARATRAVSLFSRFLRHAVCLSADGVFAQGSNTPQFVKEKGKD